MTKGDYLRVFVFRAFRDSFFFVSEDDTFDDQGCGVEVKKQADAKPSRMQVRFELGEMDVFQGFDRFQFDNRDTPQMMQFG